MTDLGELLSANVLELNTILVTITLALATAVTSLKQYFNTVFPLAETHPKALSSSALAGAWYFGWTLANISVSFVPRDTLQSMYRASFGFAAITLVLGPFLILTPTKPMVLKKETLFKAVVRGAQKKETRYTTFIVFCFLTLLQGWVLFSLYMVLAIEFGLELRLVVGIMAGYTLVALFYLAIFYSVMLRKPLVVRGVNVLEALRKGIVIRPRGGKKPWSILGMAGYIYLYLGSFVIAVLGCLYLVWSLYASEADSLAGYSSVALAFSVGFYVADFILVVVFAIFVFNVAFHPLSSASEVVLDNGHVVSVDKLKWIGVYRAQDQVRLASIGRKQDPDLASVLEAADQELASLPARPTSALEEPAIWTTPYEKWGKMHGMMDLYIVGLLATGSGYKDETSAHVLAQVFAQIAEDHGSDETGVLYAGLASLSPDAWVRGMHEFLNELLEKYSEPDNLSVLDTEAAAWSEQFKKMWVESRKRTQELSDKLSKAKSTLQTAIKGLVEVDEKREATAKQLIAAYEAGSLQDTTQGPPPGRRIGPAHDKLDEALGPGIDLSSIKADDLRTVRSLSQVSFGDLELQRAVAYKKKGGGGFGLIGAVIGGVVGAAEAVGDAVSSVVPSRKKKMSAAAPEMAFDDSDDEDDIDVFDSMGRLSVRKSFGTPAQSTTDPDEERKGRKATKVIVESDEEESEFSGRYARNDVRMTVASGLTRGGGGALPQRSKRAYLGGELEGGLPPAPPPPLGDGRGGAIMDEDDLESELMELELDEIAGSVLAPPLPGGKQRASPRPAARGDVPSSTQEEEDKELEALSRSMGLLQETAKAIGDEADEQTALLDELDSSVDRVSSPMGFAQGVHVSVDPSTGQLEGLPKSWKQMMKSSGITVPPRESAPPEKTTDKTRVSFDDEPKATTRSKRVPLKDVEKDIKDVNEIFRDLSAIVAEQETSLDLIESNIAAAKDEASRSISDLLQRGEKIEDLVDKSDDLAESAKFFNKRSTKLKGKGRSRSKSGGKRRRSRSPRAELPAPVSEPPPPPGQPSSSALGLPAVDEKRKEEEEAKPKKDGKEKERKEESSALLNLDLARAEAEAARRALEAEKQKTTSTSATANLKAMFEAAADAKKNAQASRTRPLTGMYGPASGNMNAVFLGDAGGGYDEYDDGYVDDNWGDFSGFTYQGIGGGEPLPTSTTSTTELEPPEQPVVSKPLKPPPPSTDRSRSRSRQARSRSGSRRRRSSGSRRRSRSRSAGRGSRVSGRSSTLLGRLSKKEVAPSPDEIVHSDYSEDDDEVDSSSSSGSGSSTDLRKKPKGKGGKPKVKQDKSKDDKKKKKKGKKGKKEKRDKSKKKPSSSKTVGPPPVVSEPVNVPVPSLPPLPEEPTIDMMELMNATAGSLVARDEQFPRWMEPVSPNVAIVDGGAGVVQTNDVLDAEGGTSVEWGFRGRIAGRLHPDAGNLPLDTIFVDGVDVTIAGPLVIWNCMPPQERTVVNETPWMAEPGSIHYQEVKIANVGRRGRFVIGLTPGGSLNEAPGVNRGLGLLPEVGALMVGNNPVQEDVVIPERLVARSSVLGVGLVWHNRFEGTAWFTRNGVVILTHTVKLGLTDPHGMSMAVCIVGESKSWSVEWISNDRFIGPVTLEWARAVPNHGLSVGEDLVMDVTLSARAGQETGAGRSAEWEGDEKRWNTPRGAAVGLGLALSRRGPPSIVMSGTEGRLGGGSLFSRPWYLGDTVSMVMSFVDGKVQVSYLYNGLLIGPGGDVNVPAGATVWPVVDMGETGVVATVSWRKGKDVQLVPRPFVARGESYVKSFKSQDWPSVVSASQRGTPYGVKGLDLVRDALEAAFAMVTSLTPELVDGNHEGMGVGVVTPPERELLTVQLRALAVAGQAVEYGYGVYLDAIADGLGWVLASTGAVAGMIAGRAAARLEKPESVTFNRELNDLCKFMTRYFQCVQKGLEAGARSQDTPLSSSKQVLVNSGVPSKVLSYP